MTRQAKSDTPPQYAFCPYDGTELTFGAERHGANLPSCAKCGFVDYGNPNPCVAILVERDGRVLLARRAVEPMKDYWDIPGGFIDPGESAEEAVARELLEETGLRAKKIRYLMSIADRYGPHGVRTLNLCYTVEPEDGRPEAASDVAELRPFSPNELPSTMAFEHQHKVLRAWVEQANRVAAH